MNARSAPWFVGVRRRHAAAVVIALLLSVSAVAWSVIAARPRQVVSQRQVDAAPTANTPSGCPPTASCTSDGSVRSTVLTLVRTEFGASATLASSAVRDRSSGRTYDETLLVRLAHGVDVAVSARCVPGAAAVSSSRPASVPAVGPAELSAVVPGVKGCSAGVALNADAGAPLASVWSRALVVVTAATLQLPG